MVVIVVYLVLLLGLTGHSSAIYCVCKDGVSESILQKNIDYACGGGADCSAILQAGACYQPNTVKDHCNYAVNSYFQRKGEVGGTCDFSGTANTSPTLPSTVVSGCVYQSTASTTVGTGTPSTTPPTTGTTTTPTTGTTPTPTTGTTTTPTTGTTTTPTTGTTTTPNTGTIPGTAPTTTTTIPGPPSVYSGLGPSGITDNSKGSSLQGTNFIFFASVMTLWLPSLYLLR